MAKKLISARIDEDTLTCIKGYHTKVNTLINILLKKWVKDIQDKELLIWKEETGQDELSQMKAKNDIKCSQCCNNCINNNNDRCNIISCIKTNSIISQINTKTFCCVYWEKKKGSR